MAENINTIGNSYKEVYKKNIEYTKGSIDKLIEDYSPYVYKLSLRLCKNKFEAEDLFQETWIKVCKGINKYDSNSKFENWIYSICVNCYRDSYNKEKSLLNKIKNLFSSTEEKEREINEAADENISIEEEVINKFSTENTLEYLNKLEDIYKVPLILYYFKDLSYIDIAEILKIPMGTVKSRLFKGKTILRKLMEEDYEKYRY